jgi:hypothetical protein
MGAFDRLLALFWSRDRERFDPPHVDRNLVEHLFQVRHALPQIDWGAAELWRQKHGVPLRAVAGAWLDELREALEGEEGAYRRWRHERIEGLAPAEDGIAQRVAATGEKALEVVEQSLRPVRGEAPIPEVAIIVLRTQDEYYSFIAHHGPEEGESATSGGSYINESGDAIPIVVLDAQARWGIENTIAHELTHHALHDMRLPLWLEEGFTQMMEERVTGYTNFKLDREMAERQRRRWADGFDEFFSGEAFFSAFEDDQELSYHLAQWLVRAGLSDRPEAFFAFVRACGSKGAAAAAAEHLGCELEEVGRSLLGV